MLRVFIVKVATVSWAVLLLTGLALPRLALSQAPDTGDGDVTPVSNNQPAPEPSVQPQVSEQPLLAESTTVSLSDGLWGGGLPFDRISSEGRESITTTMGVGVEAAGVGLVANDEGVARNALDAADMLTKAVSTTNVYSWQRNPLMNDIRIRGYRYEQVRTTAGGALFFPVSPNLDTPLSHIDSSFVQDVTVLKGPYSVRLGPGFSYIDVQLLESRRATQGIEYGGRSAASFNSNGLQFMASQSGWIATPDSGLFLGYTQRGGSDYHTGGSASDGGDQSIAANYAVRDIFLTYGKNLDSELPVRSQLYAQ